MHAVVRVDGVIAGGAAGSSPLVVLSEVLEDHPILAHGSLLVGDGIAPPAENLVAAELVDHQGVGVDEPAELFLEDPGIGTNRLPAVDAQRPRCLGIDIPAEREGIVMPFEGFEKGPDVVVVEPVVIVEISDGPAIGGIAEDGPESPAGPSRIDPAVPGRGGITKVKDREIAMPRAVAAEVVEDRRIAELAIDPGENLNSARKLLAINRLDRPGQSRSQNGRDDHGGIERRLLRSSGLSWIGEHGELACKARAVPETG